MNEGCPRIPSVSVTYVGRSKKQNINLFFSHLFNVAQRAEKFYFKWLSNPIKRAINVMLNSNVAKTETRKRVRKSYRFRQLSRQDKL